ncbi:hypothetical protein [Cohnella thailandensis]|uniref:Uncharacterized protein n=1 Tax=Cohnella thailandensis TaxID=557557 RepID=A0A841SY58_9BACL|nr:hypothetical protein [Cohnella thailandensis]MBB6634780.1 hypothetical protein [Cohnella thailandensis]MBP1975999.1 hypothetical protein [Cohnella thailandensis]
MYKRKLVKSTAKRTRVPAKRVTISAAKVKQLIASAQRSLSAQKPVVISQNRTIVTNGNWVNALPITRNPAWVAPQPSGSYLWGSNDPNGPAAVVARRFTINRDLDEIDTANLFLAVDNFAIVLINGRSVVIDSPQGNVSFFNPGRTFNILRFLRRGSNNIVIAAFNFPSNANRSDSNPAGVFARITIQFEEDNNAAQRKVRRRR